MDLTDSSAALQRIRETVGERVLGQDEVIDQLLAAFVARGHVLLEGVPGTAKTLLARVISGALDVRFGRVQFTPDLMPSDVTGVSIYRDDLRSFEFRAGPIFTDILLADEINRAPAKTQAALLEAMQERQVTVDGSTHPLGDLFTVIATQNPVEYEGTYPLPEAQLDRFLVNVRVGYPSRNAELEMLAHSADGFDAERASTFMPQPVLTASEVVALRSASDAVKVAPEVREYITDIIRATREDSALALGASPRASVALFRMARAAAVVAGRDFTIPDDVKQHALPVLRHRVLLAPELQVEGRSTDDVVSAVLARVTAPQ
ncbi:MAG: AAA family ATPase [Gemmatimonadaceae bacterium]